ncbi:hypothetical protein [Neokomagataea thailandica]|uniref:Uncharacterized protein n=1 Tax=Neokomagataea tanensis NBRC 106556 TaxID=1223519 RepID=A0ABQ0QJA3_9PROT|nr:MULTISPECIES: hypothetical protein [Neokomagataea]GBR46774.1 hypothetical protein AA106556_1225 [Neokomagataea tanensis NBRC 106556]
MSEATDKPVAQGWNVRIIDHSGASEGDTVEEVKDFMDLAHANAYARAYVRDSIERCRVPGATNKEVLESWFAFGENAEVLDAGDDAWKSSTELEDFAANPATLLERDWRSIDPRRLVDDDEIAGPSEAEDDADWDDEDMSSVVPH